MQIARVIGTVVSTQKNRKLEGAKLLLVQPLTLDDQPRGHALLAIDSVGAGVGERVLIVIEGRAAGDALRRKAAPVDAAIVGIIDQVDVPDRPVGTGEMRSAPARRGAADRDGVAGARPRRDRRVGKVQ
jgi:ethanolamine utilization protein EutN